MSDATKKLPAPKADTPPVPKAEHKAETAAPAVAMVACALSRAPLPVTIGTVCTAHGVTFRAPVEGMLRTSDKAGAGWPAIPAGTDAYVVAATYHPGSGAPEQTAAVIVCAVPAVSGTCGSGGIRGQWKAYPFIGGRIRLRGRDGKPVSGIGD